MFDVSARELAAYNNMETRKVLKVGAVLQIPPSGLAAPKAITTTEIHKKQTTDHKQVTKKTSTSHNGESKYTAKKGDSL